MIQEKASGLKKGLKQKGKGYVGILIHKKIAELFKFDKEVVRLSQEVTEYYKEGEHQKAVERSRILEHYIKARMNRETRYRQRAQKLSDKLEAHTDKLENVKNKIEDSRFEDLLQGVIEPENISQDVDEELLEEIYDGGEK
jgi:signal recognition particle GTPase